MVHDESLMIKAVVLNMLYIPFVTVMTYLKLPTESMMILALLLALDFFTGVFKVWVLKGSLRSCRAITGALTKGSILVLVMTLSLMAKGLDLDFEFYLSAFVSILIISETYSIFGNVYVIKTGDEVEEFDAVAISIKRVRSTIERLFNATRDEL